MEQVQRRNDPDLLGLLGLGPAARTVYAAMSANPSHGLHELAASLDLTTSQIHAACDELADLSLLRPSRERPGTLRAVNPLVGLDLLLRRQEAELARKASELAAGRLHAARMAAAYTDEGEERAAAGPNAERLTDLDAIQGKLEQLAADLQEECLSCMPGGAQSMASMEASRPLDAAAMSRGVRLLTLYQDSVRNDLPTLTYAQWMASEGGEVRTAPLVPPRMVIFDRTVAVVPLDPASTRRGALCTREPAVVASLVAVYQQAWEAAVPLGADQGEEGPGGLSPTERELLGLLSRGLTDEAVGKRLGVSMRTVRRLMAGLMERLGASSRFEAGLKAGQRGWLR